MLLALVVLDIYISGSTIAIIDFGPWSEHDSSSILFQWNELQTLAQEAPSPSYLWVLRLVESEGDCRLAIARTKMGPVELENLTASDLGDEFAFLQK